MESNKKTILILTDWYLPAVKAGGPIRSVSAIVTALKPFFDISVLTSDRDFGDDQGFTDIEKDQWLNQDGFRIKYVSPNLLSRTIRNEVKAEYEKIYLNSLFSKHFTITALQAIKTYRKNKVILAPRGMLAEGALGLKSLKKKTFLRLAKTIGLYKNVTWHASTQLEAQEIKKVFPKSKVISIENLPACRSIPFKEKSKEQGKLELVFLSRISPKKNLLFILELLSKINDQGITLDIYGPIEDDGYWSKCQTYLDMNPNFNYRGIVEYVDLQEVIGKYDLFVLPTLNENFGHIILEALSSSLPLLISDNTPWLNLDEKKIGMDISLTDIEKWEEGIRYFQSLDKVEMTNYRKQAWSYANEKLNQRKLVDQYIELFN